MNNHCLVISKFESYDRNKYTSNILYIEDYISIASVQDARKLTDKVFKNNASFISKYNYEGFKISWSWYSEIFQFCIKYLEILQLIQAIDLLNIKNIELGNIPGQYKKVLEIYFFDKKVESINSEGRKMLLYKGILLNSMMLLYSLVSISFLSLSNKNRVGSYSGDFVYKKTQSDYRLNHLYKKYHEHKINYIEFIRETTAKNFFLNIFKRKRFAIYFTSIIYFINLFHKKSVYKKKPSNFFESILFKYHNQNEVFIKSAALIAQLYKSININELVIISFNSRSAHLAVAAKSLNIKTIGIMHGLQQKEFAVYEFMESYSEEKKIGCDVYGVWSPHYLDYFKKYSKIMNPKNIFYSGLLRPVEKFEKLNLFQRISTNKIKVLIISEPLISVSEIIPFLTQLLKHNDIEAAIKVRPMVRDIYYEKLKEIFPQSSELKVFDGKIEDVAPYYDVFIGSNSTAVIEASLFGKISVLLDTIKFGDYFEIDSLVSGHLLLVKNSESLYDHIVDRVNNENSLGTILKIRKRFFGENLDGTQWIIDQIEQAKYKKI
ncbi:hypothetical protein N8516_07520 [Candidatus Thioglobus sp.]|nr:hypothetical protein [Candidatus Thioglobus sp.]